MGNNWKIFKKAEKIVLEALISGYGSEYGQYLMNFMISTKAR